MKFTLLAALIAALFSFLLGIFALIKNSKSVASRNFALFNFTLALWNISEMAASIHNHQMALYVYRLSFIGASFLPYYAATFLWSIASCKMPKAERVIKWCAIIFSIVSPTALIIKDISVDLSQLTPIEEVQGQLYYPFIFFFVTSLFYSLIPVFSEYRKATGFLRNQLRYIMAAVCIGIVGTLNYVSSQFYDKVPPLYCFVQMVLCATFATAILKHRLMDITVIIRKTLIYSGVMTVLALVYFGVVALFTQLFEGLTGYRTVYSSALGALLVTVGFQPLSKRIQSFIDAKFFRQYVDREEKLYELSREVITHTTPEAMAQSLLRVLGDTLHPKAAALYVRGQDGIGFILVSEQTSKTIPAQMAEANALADYFADHPQPFVQQDLPTELGEPMDTRRPTRNEDVA